MKEMVFLLLSGTGFCFFLFGMVLLLKPSRFLFRRRILGVIFIILSWYVFIALLVVSGLLINFPFLFRFGIPLYYIVPPLIYMYVRSIYKEEYNFRKYDWLHFVPFVLAFADLFPYFFLTDTAVKRADIIACLAAPSALSVVGNGFLPAVVHYISRGLHGLIYLVFTWRVIFKNNTSLLTEDKEAKIFTCMFTILYLGNIVNSRAILSQGSWVELYQLNSIYGATILLMLIGLGVMCMFFFTNPAILYESIAGLRAPDLNQQFESRVLLNADSLGRLSALPEILYPDKPKLEIKQDLSPVFLTDFLPRLEGLMKETQIFKQQGITVNEVALKLNVTPHVLSSVLNNHYNQRFTDFINQHRITYVIELIQSDVTYRQFSIEGLSLKAGFSSRAPFYTAFKKYTGTTPSEYLSRLTC